MSLEACQGSTTPQLGSCNPPGDPIDSRWCVQNCDSLKTSKDEKDRFLPANEAADHGAPATQKNPTKARGFVLQAQVLVTWCDPAI